MAPRSCSPPERDRPRTHAGHRPRDGRVACRFDAVDFRASPLTTLSLVVAAILGPFPLPLAFGSAYQGAVVFLVAPAGRPRLHRDECVPSALIASSAPGRSSLGPTVALVVGIVLDVLLIRPLGADGAAIAASGAFLIGGVVSLLSYRGLHDFRLVALVPRREDVNRLGGIARAATAGGGHVS